MMLCDIDPRILLYPALKHGLSTQWLTEAAQARTRPHTGKFVQESEPPTLPTPTLLSSLSTRMVKHTEGF